MKRNDLRLPLSLRDELKQPLGTLAKGTPGDTMKTLKKLVEVGRLAMLISVGDYTSKNILSAGLPLKLAIIDNKVMRRDVEPWFPSGWKIFSVENPPGMITASSWRAIEAAINLNKEAIVIVRGEEDLLTLPVIALAPIGSLVVYGQPSEGIVVVEVTEERKRWTSDFLNKMQRE